MPVFEVNTGTAASTLTGTEKLPVSQSGAPRAATVNQIRDYVFPLGLFVDAAGEAIPPSVETVTTTGYSVVGQGIATYVFDEDVDEDYVELHPRSSFLAADDRGFRISTYVLTPPMFGAIGDLHYDGGLSRWTGTNNGPAVQALLNHSFFTENALRHYYDFSGSWLTREAHYIQQEADGPMPAGSSQIRRYFRGGRLMVDELANLPGGTRLTDVLTITGTQQMWDGQIQITDAKLGLRAIGDRVFLNAIRCMSTSDSRFPHCHVEGALRHGVIMDGQSLPAPTLRAGTPYEQTLPHRNNIGARWESISARRCGSYQNNPGTSTYGLKTTVSARVYGGVYLPDLDDETFSTTTPADFVDNILQRTRLTVASTEHLAVDDVVAFRAEMTAADYGTIAIDHAARTATMSTSNWAAKGFAVGDVILFRAGNNLFTYFLINALAGAVATISPWNALPSNDDDFPRTEAARDVGLVTNQWSIHIVRKIESGTSLLVTGWVPASLNSPMYSFHGNGLDVIGGDAAGIGVGFFQAFQCGGGVRSAGSYGTKIGDMTLDFVSVGATAGSIGGAHFGLRIMGGHFEECQVDLLCAALLTTENYGIGGVHISGVSVFDKRKIEVLAGRATTTSQRPNRQIMYGVTIDLDGAAEFRPERRLSDVQDGAELSWDVARPLSNALGKNDEVIFVTSGSASVELDFDEAESRLIGAIFARVHWRGSRTTGGAPVGTMALTLTPWLIRDGWTIPQGATIANPGAPATVTFMYDYVNRKITYTVVKQTGTAISALSITATTGTLPTPNGSVTFNNAASPTLSELAEAVVELNAKIDALRAAVA